MQIAERISVREDGTHVLPLAEVRHGTDRSIVGVGELRWHPATGTRIEFILPGRQQPPENFKTDDRPGGAGQVYALSREPQWFARTIENLECRVYSAVQEVTTTMSTSKPTETVIKGQASVVELDLLDSSPIAITHDTPRQPRTFFGGLELLFYPSWEDVSYTEGSSQITRGRGWFNLTRDEQLRVYSGTPTYGRLKSAWLVRDEPTTCDPWKLYAEDYDVFAFLSFLAGRHVPMFWHDHFDRDGIISRTYYGTKTIEINDRHYKEPLPLAGVDAFSHGGTVVGRLPEMFARYISIADCFDTGWIFGPLWYGERSFVDDRLSLACVAIERLATSFDDFRRAEAQQARGPAFLSREQSKAVREALKQALQTISVAAQLSKDQLRVCERRIDQIAQPPNADKLLEVFKFLQIPVSPVEVETLANRNRCLHGRRTLEPGESVDHVGAEILRCDIITMLVHKAMLGILNYHGPYIDYAQRVRGNYPIAIM